MRTVNGNLCLTKCYPPKSKYLHPLFFKVVSSPDKSTCAVGILDGIDVRNQEGDDIDPSAASQLIEECNCNRSFQDREEGSSRRPGECQPVGKDPSKQEQTVQKQGNDIINDLIAEINGYSIDSTTFLKKIYDIHSFMGMINWLMIQQNDRFYSEKTILRVEECAWKIFSRKKNIATSVLDYYTNKLTGKLGGGNKVAEVANKKWFNYICSRIDQIYNMDLSLDLPDYSSSTNQSDQQGEPIEPKQTETQAILSSLIDNRLVFKTMKNLNKPESLKMMAKKSRALGYPYLQTFVEMIIDFLIEKLKKPQLFV